MFTRRKRESFRYRSLDLARQEFRLIRLLPKLADDGLLKYDLQHFDVDNCPRYVALSYIWGAPHPTNRIVVNNHELVIRSNLWRFLRRIQVEWAGGAKHSSWIWVDQITIDQGNVEERNHQVSTMAAIYTNAERVLVWLGRELGNSLSHRAGRGLSDSPVTAIEDETTATRADSVSSMTEAEAESDRQKFLRPTTQRLDKANTHRYWTRMWIIQEIVLAREVSILDDHGWIETWDILFHTPFRVSDPAQVAPKQSIAQDLLRYCCGRVWIKDSLLQTLGKVQIGECEKSSDTVYGLLGLLVPSQRVKVDYSRPDKDLMGEILDTICVSNTIEEIHGKCDVIFDLIVRFGTNRRWKALVTRIATGRGLREPARQMSARMSIRWNASESWDMEVASVFVCCLAALREILDSFMDEGLVVHTPEHTRWTNEQLVKIAYGKLRGCLAHDDGSPLSRAPQLNAVTKERPCRLLDPDLAETLTPLIDLSDRPDVVT